MRDFLRSAWWILMEQHKYIYHHLIHEDEIHTNTWSEQSVRSDSMLKCIWCVDTSPDCIF